MSNSESSWQTTAGTQVSTANRWRSRIMSSLSSSGLGADAVSAHVHRPREASTSNDRW